MACGLPVIASDLEGLREVGGEAADYYRPGDSPALAVLLDRLIGSPPLRRERGEAALLRSRRFSSAERARRTLELLEKVALGDHPAGNRPVDRPAAAR